ncbi:MAG: S-methyl-5-thioribose-1-phosphate isomerase [Acidilobus sp.]
MSVEELIARIDRLREYLTVKPLYWDFDANEFVWLDTRQIPWSEVYVRTKDYRRVAQAIKDMEIRGAPAIGVSAAFAMALAARYSQAKGVQGLLDDLREAYGELSKTRPTAFNLFWALDRVMRVARGAADREGDADAVRESVLVEALRIYVEDVENNVSMGRHGARLIDDGARVVTHCNTGSLATAGFGTALGVIRYAWMDGKRVHVYADETRPLLQGARLTVWELKKEGIPVTLVVDGASGLLFRRGIADLAIVGADRITLTGHVANKIGTYNLALAANASSRPFYVAAPTSTIQPVEGEEQVVIEERSQDEVRTILGRVTITVPDVEAFNPAFDVTPPELVSGIITERGVARRPYTRSLRETLGLT